MNLRVEKTVTFFGLAGRYKSLTYLEVTDSLVALLDIDVFVYYPICHVSGFSEKWNSHDVMIN